MGGTGRRKCNLYAEQFPHIMPYASVPELNAAKDIGVIMARSAQRLCRKRRDREALEILTRVAVFGWRLERENEDLVSNLAGTGIQWVAYDYLARFYEARVKTDKVEEYRGYVEARRRSLGPVREVSRPIERWSDFERVKKIGLTHSDPLWRKEACLEMRVPLVINDPQGRAQALQVLRRAAQSDPDPMVRQYTAAWMRYVEGRKRVPQ